MEAFNTFLIGTLKGGNSPIKYLPEDVLILISEHYIVENYSYCTECKNKYDLCSNKCDGYYFMNIAAKDGWLYAVKYLAKIGLEYCISHEIKNSDIWCCDDAISYAAEIGRLDIIIWLHTHYIEKVSYCAIINAAEIGRLDIIIWLYENADIIGGPNEGYIRRYSLQNNNEIPNIYDIEIDYITALDCAANHGYLNVVEWLHKNRNEQYSPGTIHVVAFRNNLDILIKLYEIDKSKFAEMHIYGDTDIVEYAALKGNLDMIIWVYENISYKFTDKVLEIALMYDHINIVVWLYKTFTEYCLIYKALKIGDLSTVKYLYNKVDVDYINRELYTNKHKHIISWLCDTLNEDYVIEYAFNLCESDYDIDRYGLNLIKKLYDKYDKFDLNYAIIKLYNTRKHSIIKTSVMLWLSKRYGVDSIMNIAVENKDYYTIQTIWEQNKKFGVDFMMDKAIEYEDCHMIEFLYDQYKKFDINYTIDILNNRILPRELVWWLSDKYNLRSPYWVKDRHCYISRDRPTKGYKWCVISDINSVTQTSDHNICDAADVLGGL